MIHREDLTANPDVMYVFGDNMIRAGLGGQAKAMRGEPNAVGVPTKQSPCEFLSDADFERVKPVLDKEFKTIKQHLKIGGVVVLPIDGIGTGLARLDVVAPKIMAYINGWIEKLEKLQ